jgi:hypothetical protein
LQKPCIEAAEPNLEKLRKDIDEPTLEKDNTDKLDPHRAYCRRLNELAKVQKFITDNELPQRAAE